MTTLVLRLVSAVAIVGVMSTGAAYLICPAQSAAARAQPGAPAPAFTASDIAGKTISIGDYRGKTVILEWTNNGCPFVGKHYNSGNMQALQQKYTAAGVVWLTIASSSPGEQGYVTPAEAKADLTRWHAAPSDYLLDPDGTLGHLYRARATPHMVVIERAGRLVYM